MFVDVVNQFMYAHTLAHKEATYQILKYLIECSEKGVFLCHRVEPYIDADWAGSIIDRRSTSGYFTFVGGNLVTWRSKKHAIVT